MIYKILLTILFIAFAAQDAPATDTRTQTDASSPAITNLSQITNFDAEIKEMIDTWSKGASTNGLFCALHFFRDGLGLEPVCYINVVNTTTNFYHTILNLPFEALFQIELFDSGGKRIEKTPLGRSLKPWSGDQIEKWLHKAIRTRARNKYILIFPFSYAQVNAFRVPELFELKKPGQYTLHLHMLLMDAKWSPSAKLLGIEKTPLPEVIAKVEIRPEDIVTASGVNGQTHAATKK